MFAVISIKPKQSHSDVNIGRLPGSLVTKQEIRGLKVAGFRTLQNKHDTHSFYLPHTVNVLTLMQYFRVSTQNWKRIAILISIINTIRLPHTNYQCIVNILIVCRSFLKEGFFFTLVVLLFRHYHLPNVNWNINVINF